MKHFNTIVIGLGAILGIAVVGPQFLSGPGNVTSDMPQEEYAAPAVDTADGLPQPSPIAPAPAEEQAAATPDERLTPMPTPEIPVTEEAQTMDLAPLDPGPDLGFDNVGVKEGPEQTAELDDPTPPLPIEGATNIEKPVVELPDPIAFENQPIPTAAPPEEAPEEELASLPEPEVQETAPSPADPPQLTPPAEEPQADMPEEMATPAVDSIDTPAPLPTGPSPETLAELEKLSADNEALNARNKDLEEEISGANTKIEELAAMLEAMEKKIAALEEAPPAPTPAPVPAAVAPEPEPETPAIAEEPEAPDDTDVAAATEPDNEPANILVPAKPERRPENVPQMKSKPAETAPKISTSSAADSPRWVLRSAQTGRAVVSDRSTGDLRSIQVGDSLRGVGTIQSISKVSGRWVVQGSQGRVQQ
ncbi:MAG: hypothetical protein LRY76_09145 [Alphaproteobacteria bacterium]|nr:hypothetical protein [Alphaproteobacteria bacterium]